VGTIFIQLALERGNPTVVGVVLNIQPVLSTTAAVLIFRDRLAPMFGIWALVAVLAGMVLVGLAPGLPFSVDTGVGYALLCALFWGLATVAGRGVMVEMSLPLAAGLRVVVGLVTMTIILVAYGQLTPSALWPVAAAADASHVITWLVLLATLSGGVPLVIYFQGLA